MNVSMNGQLRPRQILPALSIPIFLAISNQTMVAAALPAIGADFGAVARLPWLVIGYVLAMTITAPVFGTLGDSFGRAKMLMIALWVFVAGGVLCALAPWLEILALGRFVQGLGGGGLMVLSQALIGQFVISRERGRAQGYVATIGVVASTLGPLVGSLLVAAVGWRIMFVVSVLPALLAMFVVARKKFPHGDVPVRGFDPLGLMVMIGFVVSWVAAIEVMKDDGGNNISLLLGGVGIIALVALILTQRRSKYPLFAPRLFAIPDIQRTSILVTCHGAALVSLVTLVPLFQAIVRGEDTLEAAGKLLALTIALGTSGIVTGNLMTITGKSTLFPSLSLPIAAGGIFALGIYGPTMSDYMQLALYGIIGISIGSVMAVVQTAFQVAAPEDLRGRAAGSVTFFRSIGAVLGTAIVTLVLFAHAPLEGGANPRDIFAGAAAIGNIDHGGWANAFQAAFNTIATIVLVGWSMAAITTIRRR